MCLSVPKQVLQSQFCTPTDNPVGIPIAQGDHILSERELGRVTHLHQSSGHLHVHQRAPSPVASYTFSPMDDVAIARGSCAA